MVQPLFRGDGREVVVVVSPFQGSGLMGGPTSRGVAPGFMCCGLSGIWTGEPAQLRIGRRLRVVPRPGLNWPRGLVSIGVGVLVAEYEVQERAHGGKNYPKLFAWRGAL